MKSLTPAQRARRKAYINLAYIGMLNLGALLYMYVVSTFNIPIILVMITGQILLAICHTLEKYFSALGEVQLAEETKKVEEQVITPRLPMPGLSQKPLSSYQKPPNPPA